jgi:hypothetical protein
LRLGDSQVVIGASTSGTRAPTAESAPDALLETIIPAGQMGHSSVFVGLFAELCDNYQDDKHGIL